MNQLDVAICIPCRNEEFAITAVVEGFRTALPTASIFVIDNGSSDRTSEVASLAGATVIREPRPGKGHAISRAFADINASCYLMVDGDGTYDPERAREMVALVLDHRIDMVVCARTDDSTASNAYRAGHRLGNAVLSSIFRNLFSLQLSDSLSGYRAMSRRFVKSFPTAATGFEIEAELNIHAAITQVPVEEVVGAYRDRIAGTESKLNTFRDGFRILRRNLRLFRDARPSIAFSLLAFPWFVLATILVGVSTVEFLQSGLVSRFPSLIAGIGAFLVALNTSIAGLVLERVARNRREAVRLAYLALPR